MSRGRLCPWLSSCRLAYGMELWRLCTCERCNSCVEERAGDRCAGGWAGGISYPLQHPLCDWGMPWAGYADLGLWCGSFRRHCRRHWHERAFSSSVESAHTCRTRPDEGVEGFKMFLTAVDSDRLQTIARPDKTPQLFERFLPYAFALGVEHAWRNNSPRCWRRQLRLADRRKHRLFAFVDSGSSFGSFSATNFASSFSSSFSSAISSSSTAPGSSSGSGGWRFVRRRWWWRRRRRLSNARLRGQSY